MKRREFITLLAASAAWPLAVRGPVRAQTAVLPHLGLLTLNAPAQMAKPLKLDCEVSPYNLSR